MSVILQPQVAFPIVRQIANHLDAVTYYVRAVVRDADGDTIATVDLESQGSQRYSRKWQVPADPTGRGIYISIVTSVYTDAGYTTKSENYGDEETTYLVFDRVSGQRGGSVGASVGVDYYRIRQMLVEELQKLPKPVEVDYSRIPKPERYEMRWDELLLALEVVRQAVKSLPQQAVDLSPVMTGLDTLKRAVEDKPVTPEADLTPIITLLVDAADDRQVNHKALMSTISDVVKGVEKHMSEGVARIRNLKFVGSLETTLAAPEEPTTKAKTFNVKKLT